MHEREIKMHGYYIHYRDINNPASSMTGSDKKVKGQIKAFNKAGLNCKFLYCPHPESFIGMAKSSLPFLSDGVRWPNVKDIKDADYIYIRKPRFFSKTLVDFLRDLKNANPDILIICEIPSYPYDREMMRPRIIPAFIKDRIHRRQLKGLVDYFADLSQHSEIFGIETVPFINGIDLEEIKPKGDSAESESLNIISVAYFEFWHGIDRLVLGLSAYYAKGGQRDIHLHLVGDGGKVSELRKLVAKYGLGDRVTFYGSLMPEDIDPIYDKCQYGVSSLGLHRIDPDLIACTLKSREYLAKGLPFAYSSKVDIFETHPNDFCLEFPATDDPIDISKLVEKYDSLSKAYPQEELIRKTRDYAERVVSMDSAMKSVVDLISKGKED